MGLSIVGLREERGQDDGQQLEMPPLDSVVARLGTLGREQQLGEKPPWLYVREEENTQLLFQLTFLLPELDKELGGGMQLLVQLSGRAGVGQLLQLCEGAGTEHVLQIWAGGGGGGGQHVLELQS